MKRPAISAAILGFTVFLTTPSMGQNTIWRDFHHGVMRDDHQNTTWFTGMKLLTGWFKNYDYTDEEFLGFLPDYVQGLYRHDSPLPWAVAEEIANSIHLRALDLSQFPWHSNDLAYQLSQFGPLWLHPVEGSPAGLGGGFSIILFGAFENEECGMLFLAWEMAQGRFGVFRIEEFVPLPPSKAIEPAFDGMVIYNMEMRQ
jgi:hypothetical protein